MFNIFAQCWLCHQGWRAAKGPGPGEEAGQAGDVPFFLLGIASHRDEVYFPSSVCVMAPSCLGGVGLVVVGVGAARRWLASTHLPW